MSDEKAPDPNRRTALLMAFLALWALAALYSVVVLTTTEPTGSGFTRGFNRITGFFGWQAIAGLLAIPAFALSRGWPKGSAVRRLGAVPLGIALGLVTLIAGVILWARLG